METADMTMSGIARAAADPAALPTAAAVVRHLGADLFGALAERAGNLALSPYSVAAGLAMTRNGARGETAAEIDRVLQSPGPADLNSGFNALTGHLDGRAGPVRRTDGSAAEVALQSANSLWGQRGIGWAGPFLDDMAAYYGAGLRLVDFGADPADAAAAVNTWAAARTAGRIAHLVPAGALDASTRLLVVNAVHFKAPWEEPFDAAATRPAQFTRPDGSTVTVPMMGKLMKRARYASGPGWQAVDLPYAGSRLAMAVVVPDLGHLAVVRRSLDGAGLADLLAALRPAAVAFDLPRFTFRTRCALGEHLGALGMHSAFTDRADFSGLTETDKVMIDAVLHEAFIAVDEEGTEASAATAVMIGLTSALADPLRVSADRPFLFVVHDIETATPLFLGRVEDPTEA
ncbi:MAG: serpin family protein [Mycobacteriales bacterium]